MSSVSSCTDESNPQVFISFRGEEMRLHFVGHLVKELKRRGINVFIDNHETMGEDLTIFYERIEKSKIAIVVISSKYTESLWCLNELAKIKECAEKGDLRVFPVFYKVSVNTVRDLTGPFGDSFRLATKKAPEQSKKWKEALRFVTKKKGLTVKEDSDGSLMIDTITDEIKKMLALTSTENPIRNNTESKMKSERSYSTSSPLSGIETRLEQLEEKLIFKRSNENVNNVTRVIGVIGIPGIGKTTLAKALMEKWQHKFVHTMFLDDISEKSDFLTVERIKDELISGLWNSKYTERSQFETHEQQSIEYLMSRVSDKKVFIVLDDVSNKSQIEDILSGREWIKRGSKVVIITSDISAIEVIVDDVYMVPPLNHDEALKHFEKYAGEIKGNSFKKLASEFVDYSKGHPLTLKVLGTELFEKDEMYWESKLESLVNSPIQNNLITTMSNVSSSVEPLYPQVFISFRGDEMRLNFIGHLVKELKRRGINVFIDNCESKGEDLSIFYERIEKSKIAVAVISSKYAESVWCLNELAKIKECVDKGDLRVFPVFYKVRVDNVSNLTGPFGDSFRVTEERKPESGEIWKEALQFLTKKKGCMVKEDSDESLIIDRIADEIKKMLVHTSKPK